MIRTSSTTVLHSLRLPYGKSFTNKVLNDTTTTIKQLRKKKNTHIWLHLFERVTLVFLSFQEKNSFSVPFVSFSGHVTMRALLGRCHNVLHRFRVWIVLFVPQTKLVTRVGIVGLCTAAETVPCKFLRTNNRNSSQTKRDLLLSTHALYDVCGSSKAGKLDHLCARRIRTEAEIACRLNKLLNVKIAFGRRKLFRTQTLTGFVRFLFFSFFFSFFFYRYRS